MTPQYTSNGPHRPEIFLEKWLWFVLLGNLLIVAGIVAILLPVLSQIGAGRVLAPYPSVCPPRQITCATMPYAVAGAPSGASTRQCRVVEECGGSAGIGPDVGRAFS